jgi:hypothetical protein
MKMTGWTLRHNEELYELSDKSWSVQYIMASHTVQMEDTRLPKKVMNWKFHGRKPVGRPQLREKDIVMMDS